MTYYDTIEEDLARAKTILEKGKMHVDEIERHVPVPPGLAREIIERGGTIYGADIYAAYKLLESFVAEIERRPTTTAPLELAAFMAFIRGVDIPNTIEGARVVLVERALRAEAAVERLRVKFAARAALLDRFLVLLGSRDPVKAEAEIARLRALLP